jgi:predicted nucleic acid-binding protein
MPELGCGRGWSAAYGRNSTARKAISVQVLNEIANVARRKTALTWVETRAFIAPLRQLLTVHPLTGETHETGLTLAERYGPSTWDAMIVASALMADCDVLWTEGLQDGMEIAGGLRVRNPFGCFIFVLSNSC